MSDDIYNCPNCHEVLREEVQRLPSGEVVEQLVCDNVECPVYGVRAFKS